jgi:flagellar biosynthesis GTPase FlhF
MTNHHARLMRCDNVLTNTESGADGGGPGGGGLFGNVFGESISSPFGKASELAMAEAEDDDDYESPMTTPTAAGREESERAEREARERAEREAREKAEREAREKAEREARERTEREEKEKARKKQEEEAAKEKAAKAKQEAQALDEKKRADAKKKADAIKVELWRRHPQTQPSLSFIVSRLTTHEFMLVLVCRLSQQETSNRSSCAPGSYRPNQHRDLRPPRSPRYLTAAQPVAYTNTDWVSCA